jgi:hypothetical protein
MVERIYPIFYFIPYINNIERTSQQIFSSLLHFTGKKQHMPGQDQQLPPPHWYLEYRFDCTTMRFPLERLLGGGQ